MTRDPSYVQGLRNRIAHLERQVTRLQRDNTTEVERRRETELRVEVLIREAGIWKSIALRDRPERIEAPQPDPEAVKHVRFLVGEAERLGHECSRFPECGVCGLCTAWKWLDTLDG